MGSAVERGLFQATIDWAIKTKDIFKPHGADHVTLSLGRVEASEDDRADARGLGLLCLLQWLWLETLPFQIDIVLLRTLLTGLKDIECTRLMRMLDGHEILCRWSRNPAKSLESFLEKPAFHPFISDAWGINVRRLLFSSLLLPALTAPHTSLAH